MRSARIWLVAPTRCGAAGGLAGCGASHTEDEQVAVSANHQVALPDAHDGQQVDVTDQLTSCDDGPRFGPLLLDEDDTLYPLVDSSAPEDRAPGRPPTTPSLGGKGS